MTTLLTDEDTCMVCGRTGRFAAVASYSVLGPSDLDSRPPETLRSTLPYAIRRCPGCGYCAPRLRNGTPQAADVVRSDAYRRQLQDPRFDELANSFLCGALIQERIGRLDQAGWAAVQAAWSCDDRRAWRRAADCRARAIALFRAAHRAGLRFADQPAAEHAVLADLLRRTRQFTQAVRETRQGLAADPEPETEVIRQVLDYQLRLARRKDSRRYTLPQAPLRK